MSSLAKTNALAATGSVEIRNAVRTKPIYYLPVNTTTTIREEQKNIASARQDIPIDKWIMPVQPQGYLSAKQYDIF